ncbi:MAG: hypothetical protein M1480_07290 [Bacteroidetes bacterium]|nr:hypothetical protein [Bacteroidota bacterium]
MLLETLDIKHNDVIIYSQNLFDLEKNFKIINKDDPNKEHRKISYSEVCRIANEFTPKNLIVYRLLTNIKDFEISLSKYGFMLNINGVNELIYFDPIYAVKDLEDYPYKINFNELRFRIQQVGLTTLNRKGNLPNYAEIYNIDLEAIEAKFQNDKVFADAIFSVSAKTKHDKMEIISKVPDRKKIIQEKPIARKEKFIEKISEQPAEKEKTKSDKISEIPKMVSNQIVDQKNKTKNEQQHIDGIKIIKHEISEDKDFDYKQIMKINFKGASGINGKKLISNVQTKGQPEPNVLPKLVKTEERTKSSFGKFLEEKHADSKEKKKDHSTGEIKVSPLIDIFKSPTSLANFVKERENKQVILKLDRK